MTTDPFTTARDDAARFLWALPDDHPAKPLHNDGFMQTHARVVASLMAEWTRSYLATQEPTDAEVREAGVAIVSTVLNLTAEQARAGFDTIDRNGYWSGQARAALSAARAALAEGGDER